MIQVKPFTFTDEVSGLKLTLIEGEKLNIIRVERITEIPLTIGNRDFWFTKEGNFDGTGSAKVE